MARGIAIITLYQEIEVTKRTLAYVVEECAEDDRILVFVNGGDSSDLDRIVGKHPGIEIHSSSRNLGVAGARRKLLELFWDDEYEFIHILDNDIVVPIGYFTNIENRYRTLDTPGVLGAAIVDYHKVKDLLNGSGDRFKFKGDRYPRFNRADALQYMERIEGNPFFHIGTNKDFQKTYLANEEIFQYLCVRLDMKPAVDFHGTNKNDFRLRDYLASSEIRDLEVMNVAGACQCFLKKHLERVGNIADIFSPYGYEDAEFCSRFQRIGLKNYVSNCEYAIHGFDTRHEKRRTGFGEQEATINTVRAWYHLVAENVKEDEALEKGYRRLLIYYIYRMLLGEPSAYRKLLYGKIGLDEGRRERAEKEN